MGTKYDYTINRPDRALCGLATLRRALAGKIDLAVVDYGGYRYVGTWTQCERALRRDCRENDEPYADDCIGWASIKELRDILQVENAD